MHPRVVTLGFLNCPEVPAADLVTIAARAGFASVGIRITGRRANDAYPTVAGNRAAIDEIRRRLAADPIRLSNVSAYHLYPDVTPQQLAAVLSTARALGSGMALVSCYDPDRERFCAMLSRYAEVAAEHGLRLALEFVPFSEAKTLDDALDIVRRVGKENLGLVIDPLHLMRSGGRPEDLARVPPEHFFFAQLCDAAATRPENRDLATEARTMRLPPGKGALPLTEILDALPEHLELECEFPTEENLRLAPDVRALRIRTEAADYLAAYAMHREGRAV